MNNIKFRLAKPSDASEIADVHWHVRDRYTKGIFLSLGKSFLKAYYNVILDDPWEVVVCAVNDKGHIVGFASTTLDAREQAENLRKHKIYLGVSALWAILKNPKLINAVWQRYKSLSGDNSNSFVHTEGVRGEYWCWRKEEDSLKSVELSKVKNEILYDLGIREFFFEVDKFNAAVYRFHLKVNKGIPIEEIKLPDGRERVLMKKELKRNFDK